MTEASSSPYSARMRVGIAIARAIAAARGDVDLTPTHIALGLLREGENAAVAALHHAGLDLNKVRYELEMQLGELGRPHADEIALSLTEGERTLIEAARNESGLRGDEYVGPQHLLLAILRDELSSVAQIFLRHRLNYSTALTHLDAVIHKHS